jgi:hypothetical protein
MERSPDEIESLAIAEVGRIGDPARRARASALLTRPAVQSIEWDYGVPGERLDCWVVGARRDGRVMVVYCDAGFGPERPWGFVHPDEDSAGMASQWHASLEEALAAAGMLDDSSPAVE